MAASANREEQEKVEDLPTGYYLENFVFLLDFVYRNYADLLTESETAYVRDFQNLSLKAQRLYVRLTGRRGPLFRLDKLVYEEIGCIESAVRELSQKHFVQEPAETPAIDLLSLLTRQELVERFAVSDRKLKRGGLVDFIVEQYSIVEIHENLGLVIIEPLGQTHLQVFKLLFFGNLYQDFTEFVLRDLGVSPFENYAIDASARYFENRETLDSTLAAYGLADVCREVLEEGNADRLSGFACTYLAEKTFTEPRIHYRYSKIYNSVARQLERYDRVEEAIPLYGQSIIPPARERTSRIFDRLGRVDEAVDICRLIYEDPMDEAEAEFSVKFATRLCKRHGMKSDWLPAPIVEDFEFEQASVVRQPEVPVEIQACHWFESQNVDARYVENGLLPGLFGLYFWDVIFLQVKGVFFNPFQRGPADLFTPEFRTVRQSLIQSRLEKMSVDTFLENTVLDTFNAKSGFANHFVNWRWLDSELISKSLECIPVNELKLIFERILRDLRNNRSGFPDLIVFPDTGGFCLIEIKGPGDRLQNNQKRWFRFFKASGIPARVLNVAWK